MKITEHRTKEILNWLDDKAADHVLLFEKMTLHRDAAALIRQLQAEVQDAWQAGLDEGRAQGRGKDHAHPPPSVPEAQGGGEDREPDDGKVICPACCHQFRAIPVQVQRDMIAAGFEPPFTAPPSVPVGEDANELASVRARLKSGDYDGADVMRAWLAIDKLLAQQPGGSDNGR